LSKYNIFKTTKYGKLINLLVNYFYYLYFLIPKMAGTTSAVTRLAAARRTVISAKKRLAKAEKRLESREKIAKRVASKRTKVRTAVKRRRVASKTSRPRVASKTKRAKVAGKVKRTKRRRTAK